MEMREVYIENRKIKMVYLTDRDKKNIIDMDSSCSIIAQFDDEKDTNEVIKLMKKFKKEMKK